MDWNEIGSLIVAVFGVVAALGSWWAASQSAAASDKAAKIAQQADERAREERHFLAYERHTLSLARAKADAQVLEAKARRREAQVLATAAHEGNLSSSRVALVLAEVRRLGASIRECSDLLNGVETEVHEVAGGGFDPVVVKDFEHRRLMVERMRIKIQQFAAELEVVAPDRSA